jgi:small conductance mechanosensitive channel
LAEAANWLVVTPLSILLIVAGALIVNHIGRKWSARFVRKLGAETKEHDQLVSERGAERATQRAETMGLLLKGLVTASVFFIATVLVLERLGIDIVTAIASAGVFALAIGFGAQSVVADLFAGLFMLAEDQLGVGDRVDVGVVNGYVVRVTPRTTVIRDPNGKEWHVPNSQIDYVANETQSWARATVTVGIAFGQDTQAATSVILDAATDLAESDDWEDDVLEAPVAQAGQDLGDGVDIRVCVHVDPEQRRPLERALRVYLVDAISDAGIEMSNPALNVFVKE